MIFKYVAILLALTVVVLAGKRDRDDVQRSGCPCLDAYSSQDDEPLGRKGGPCSGSYERVEDCPKFRKDRKAFEKIKDKKFKQRRSYEDEDEEVFSERPEFRFARSRDFPEEEDEFVVRRDGKPRKMKKDRKYKRDQFDRDEEMEPELFTSSVSPQCLRFINDVNKLARCERKVQTDTRKRTFEDERDIPEYPASCQKYAYDPFKLTNCVRKSNPWADFTQRPGESDEQQSVHPECQHVAYDPYRLSKCERKMRKFEGEYTKKSSKGFY